MPPRKNHHYVPQFLLRYFATDEKQRTIRLYLVKAGKVVENASIRHQCSVDYFYGTGGELEKKFGELKGAASKVVAALTTGEVPEPLTEEYALFLVFVCFQKNRTLRAAKAVATQYEAFSRVVVRAADDIVRESDHPIIPLDAPAPVDAIGLSLDIAGELAFAVQDLRLKVLVNETEEEFVTSDAPVVFHNQWSGKTGATSQGLQIFFPVSPVHMAIFYDPDIYQVGWDNGDSAAVKTVEEVRSLNFLQLGNADHAVYFRDSTSAKFLTPRTKEPPAPELRRYRGPRGSGQLVGMSAPASLDVTLVAGTIRLRTSAMLVPRKERAAMFRSEAMMMTKERDHMDSVKGSLPSGPFIQLPEAEND
ncbi:MAG: DUF4238 domain-containing protein [Polyangiales bacterium]